MPKVDERGVQRIGDVDDPRLAAALQVADAGWRACVRPLGVRQAGVDERLAEVVAVTDLQLVEAACAAAGVEHRQQRRIRRVRHVPETEPTLASRGRILAKDVAHLQADRGDVVAGERPVLGRVDDDVLMRGARHLEVRDLHRVGRVVRVDDRDTARRAELRM